MVHGLRVPPLRLVRNVDAGSFLESFLVAAVSAVLVIRVYLELTGYPQIGGRGLHIAHMLWGGALLVVGVVLLLAYLGKWVQHLAAIVAGIGFGTFIDELGKFITSDNNYFFQPTIALIYAIFVLLFLWFRAIERRQQLSPTECLGNAVELLREAVLRPQSGARERGLALLARADADNPLVRGLQALFLQTACSPAAQQPFTASVAGHARAAYERLIGFRWFHRLIVGGFLLHAAVAIVALIVLIATDPRFSWIDPAVSIEDWGDTLSTALSTVLVVLGAIRLRASRLFAYYWFKRSILVSIFLVQFFAFYTEQLGAVVGLAIDLVILGALNYMIREERAVQAARLVAGSAPPARAVPAPAAVASRVASEQ
ncbi:MAG TPA: hypothetical protein VK066_30790 [Chloroflexota bacterium]|nr:hypothetical protein [Chloroflexota bacterium]